MPELPEVETVRLGLQRLLPGRIVRRVWHDWPKSFPNTEADVQSFLIGARIEHVRRRAKVLLIDLSSGYTLVTHLKMTGQLVFVPTAIDNSTSFPPSNSLTPMLEERFGAGHPNDSLIGQLPDKSTRVSIEFTDEAALYFNDQRKFGWMRLIPTAEVPNIDFMRTVGPEPLEADFSDRVFIERLVRRNRSNIKAVLLDQTVIAGVGNIYADESLYAAGIHPLSTVGAIPLSKLKRLKRKLVGVLQLSIEKGGSADRNYVNAEGKRGSYIDFARVFRRESQSCMKCGRPIEKIRVAGRGTHICTRCQKLYTL